MKLFTFKHVSREETYTVVAANKEAAQKKLEKAVSDPTNWKLEQ